MLANSFMKPKDLGISESEVAALIRVLGMLDRGEITDDQFNMDRVVHPCGTPSCMCGWARYVSHGVAFPGREPKAIGSAGYPSEMPDSLAHLFAMHPYSHPRAYYAKPTQAAIALRNFLTTGEPRWSEALATD